MYSFTIMEKANGDTDFAWGASISSSAVTKNIYLNLARLETSRSVLMECDNDKLQ